MPRENPPQTLKKHSINTNPQTPRVFLPFTLGMDGWMNCTFFLFLKYFLRTATLKIQLEILPLLSLNNLTFSRDPKVLMYFPNAKLLKMDGFTTFGELLANLEAENRFLFFRLSY